MIACCFRYVVSPSDELNFGALLVNNKKSKTFTIENKHQFFDFAFTITKVPSVHDIVTPIVTAPVTDQKKVRKYVLHLYLFWVTGFQSLFYYFIYSG